LFAGFISKNNFAFIESISDVGGVVFVFFLVELDDLEVTCMFSIGFVEVLYELF
jgi:hypothetical protein